MRGVTCVKTVPLVNLSWVVLLIYFWILPHSPSPLFQTAFWRIINNSYKKNLSGRNYFLRLQKICLTLSIHTQLAFNSTAINFRIAKFRRSNLGPKFALKMGPKFALADIFQNKMGRGYLLMNPKKSEVCTLGYIPSPKFLSVWSEWFWIYWWWN